MFLHRTEFHSSWLYKTTVYILTNNFDKTQNRSWTSQSILPRSKVLGCSSFMVLLLFSKWEPQTRRCCHPSKLSKLLQYEQPVIILLTVNRWKKKRPCAASEVAQKIHQIRKRQPKHTIHCCTSKYLSYYQVTGGSIAGEVTSHLQKYLCWWEGQVKA